MVDRRKSMIYVILGMFLIGEVGTLFFNSGVVPGLNRRADKLKVYAMASRDDATVLPGDIYDCKGNMIVETQYETVTETDDKGNEKENTKRVTKYSDGKAFSQTVGYTGDRKLTPFADDAEDVVGNRNGIRLMAFLNEDYWGENGLYSTVNTDGTKGQSAVLTIDSNLQLKVFKALKNQMSDSNDIGSAVVLNAKTGEILADVAFPTYDFNDLGKAKQQMLEDGEKTDLEPFYPVTYKYPQTPGSIFKILTSVALLDHGMEDFKVSNEAYTVETADHNWTCKTSEYYSGSLCIGQGDEIDMEKALNISSNVYFSQAALELGKEKLQETADKFGLTADQSTILTDFGNIHYNWDISESDDILAQTGFGQGRTELTTIHAAMITGAIANHGKMMKPYMVSRLVDAKGKTVYEGKPECYSEATSKKTTQKLTKYLRSTATECCNLHELYGVKEVFDRYKVAGKTGTAENGDEANTTNAWYVSFAPADDPEYVVVVNQCKTQKQGYKMMPVVADIYQYLFEKYE